MVKIIDVSRSSSLAAAIAEAAAVIRAGGLVVYPTETVYGLGADATSDEAAARVFVAKGRPIENPLPIAVDSLGMAKEVMELDSAAELLFEKFMPGPLTIVGKVRPGKISKLVTGGTGNVGVRIPDNAVALGLVKRVGRPITATSANISGRLAPTTAMEALNQLGSSIELVLDSGKSKIGQPSTVIDISSGMPRIIRGGPISGSDVEKLLKKLGD